MALTPIKEHPGDNPDLELPSTRYLPPPKTTPDHSKNGRNGGFNPGETNNCETNFDGTSSRSSPPPPPPLSSSSSSFATQQNGVNSPEAVLADSATPSKSELVKHDVNHVNDPVSKAVARHSSWKTAARRALTRNRREVAQKIADDFETKQQQQEQLQKQLQYNSAGDKNNNNFLTVDACLNRNLINGAIAGGRDDKNQLNLKEQSLNMSDNGLGVSAADANSMDRLQGEGGSAEGNECQPSAPPFLVEFFDKIGCWKQYVVPFGYALLTILYAVFGGAVYYAIEYPAEKESNAQAMGDHLLGIRTIAINISQLFEEQYGYVGGNNSSSLPSVDLQQQLNDLLESYHRSSGHEPSDVIHWTFMGSIWFAITIFTTIGYGNYVPSTIPGKVFTMIYAIFGIPLVLLTLGEVGKLFTLSLKRAYNNFIELCHTAKHRLRRSSFFSKHRHASHNSEKGCAIRNQSYISKDEDDFSSIYTDSEWVEFDFPIPFAMSLILGWILLVSLITWSLGEFDFFSSIYFWFISFTTIGLGDYTPKKESTAVLFIPIFFVGLALISMVITLLQSNYEKMEDIVLEDYLGWDTESADSSSSEDEDDDDVRPGDRTQKTSSHDYHHHRGGGSGGGSNRTLASTLSGQPITLGIFHASNSDVTSSDHHRLSTNQDHPEKLKRALSLWTKEQPKSVLATVSVGGAAGAAAKSPRYDRAVSAVPCGQNTAAAKLPKNVAKVLEMQKVTRTEKRTRRGVQTDESYVFESKVGKEISWRDYKKAHPRPPAAYDELVVEYFDEDPQLL